MHTERLIPGVLSDRVNCGLYYAHIMTAVVTLILILVITFITSLMVHHVSETASETSELVKDMNLLLPDAKFGIKLMHALCNNGNFTRMYPNVRNLCADL